MIRLWLRSLLDLFQLGQSAPSEIVEVTGSRDRTLRGKARRNARRSS